MDNNKPDCGRRVKIGNLDEQFVLRVSEMGPPFYKLCQYTKTLLNYNLFIVVDQIIEFVFYFFQASFDSIFLLSPSSYLR